MKKLFFTLALLVQVIISMAANTVVALLQARHENVKMFQQASTSTPVLETISTTDKVEFMRNHNKDWIIVSVKGKAGYVLATEMTMLKTEKSAHK